jgi:hypothetical protein
MAKLLKACLNGILSNLASKGEHRSYAPLFMLVEG